MTQIEDWLAKFTPIEKRDLGSDAAKLVRYVEEYGNGEVKYKEGRTSDIGDLVLIDIHTPIPQYPIYPINRCESVGLLYLENNPIPIVYILRDDFPDTEHQLLTSANAPKAICIDDRNWSEARLTWTSSELINRIWCWFYRAGYGKLHDPRQPLDPVLLRNPQNFLISRDLLSGNIEHHHLMAIYDKENKSSVRIEIADNQSPFNDNIEPYYIITYSIPPEKMRRFIRIPNTLNNLANLLCERGIELYDDLKKKFCHLLDLGSESIWQLNSRFAVILEIPIISPHSQEHNGTDLRAFVANNSVGEIAEALGIAFRETESQHSEAGFVKQISPSEVNIDKLKNTKIVSAEVHYEFDRKLATKLTGEEEIDDRKVVMIGAGAIGSHVAECLIREGNFCWTIVDGDQLLPHNLARHIGCKNDVSKNKASLVASKLTEIIDAKSKVAHSIPSQLVLEESQQDEINQAFEEAQIIIDATASRPVERYLSDHSSNARRVCIFFNPTGNSAVLLVEPTDRTITLRDLEAQYLSFIVQEKGLERHLTPPQKPFAYTGACQAITNIIPQSQVMTLSGLVAKGLIDALNLDDPTIKIWSLKSSGEVEVFKPKAIHPMKNIKKNDWIVSINQGLINQINRLREEKLPEETGGILTGVVDIPAKRIQIIEASPAPPDSKSSQSSFERGVSGVKENLDQLEEHTLGQVKYLGEWHSHPNNVAVVPSKTDESQLDWLGTLVDVYDLPLMMIIAGEQRMKIYLPDRQ